MRTASAHHPHCHTVTLPHCVRRACPSRRRAQVLMALGFGLKGLLLQYSLFQEELDGSVYFLLALTAHTTAAALLAEVRRVRTQTHTQRGLRSCSHTHADAHSPQAAGQRALLRPQRRSWGWRTCMHVRYAA